MTFTWEEHDDINPTVFEAVGKIVAIRKWRCTVNGESLGCIVKQDGFDYRVGTRWLSGAAGISADTLDNAKSAVERNIRHNLEKLR